MTPPPQITETDLRKHTGDGMQSRQNVIDAANEVLKERWEALTASAPKGEPCDMLPAETVAWSFIDYHQAPVELHAALADLVRRARNDTSPPPAAGWDEAITTAIHVAKQSGAKTHPRVEALRREAPPPRGLADAPDHTDLMVTPESIDDFMEANPLSHPDAGGGVREALDAIGMFFRVLRGPSYAKNSISLSVTNADYQKAREGYETLKSLSTAGNAIAALQAMLRLFDDQGNMVADFNAVQSAVENGYAVISRQARSEASANGL